MDYSDFNKHIQKFGRFLSGMVMPNIGAFIAWGLMTALFIPSGWFPNEQLAVMVVPMIRFMLPMLIGYTGGKIVYDMRGGAAATVVVFGMILGTTEPMFLGAMVLGPLVAYLLKELDHLLDKKTPTGFEMLVHNFSSGILSGGLAVLAFLSIGPLFGVVGDILSASLSLIIRLRLLPIAAVFIEPAKVLFLNNAVNHGILSPLGVEQAAEVGKSIFFLLEANPGPGLGILLAYYFFTKGTIRQSVPGAMVIHFFGGIHEIYFPYVLMQPKLLIAAIAGNASGILIFSIFDAGLVATPSPGSFVAIMALSAKGSVLGVFLGIIGSAFVSFLTASALINRNAMEEDFEEANRKKQEGKYREESRDRNLDVDTEDKGYDSGNINLGIDSLKHVSTKHIVVACDAGMGSSAVGAGKLKDELKMRGLDIKVSNFPIDNIPLDADIIVTHKSLAKRAKSEAPYGVHIIIKDFINTNIYERIADRLLEDKKQEELNNKQSEHSLPGDIWLEGDNNQTRLGKVDEDMFFKKAKQTEPETLTRDNIRLGLESVSKEEAIRLAGQILVDGGYVDAGYIDAMVQRDSELSTFIGNGTAIPHGVNEAKKNIIHTGISILQYPDGVDFDGNTVYLVVGIAGKGNEHLTILGNLAEIVEEEEKVEEIRRTTDLDFIYKLFTN